MTLGRGEEVRVDQRATRDRAAQRLPPHTIRFGSTAEEAMACCGMTGASTSCCSYAVPRSHSRSWRSVMSDIHAFRNANESDQGSNIPLHRPWLYEPVGMEGGVVAMSQVLIDRADLRATLVKAIAYSQGVRLNLAVLVRGMDDPEEWLQRQIRGLRAPSNRSLSFSVKLPGGLSASTQDEAKKSPPAGGAASGVVLIGGVGRGASFGDRSKQAELGYVLWMAPLPPAQSLQLTMSWPEMGVQGAHAPVDGLALRVAAHDARAT